MQERKGMKVRREVRKRRKDVRIGTKVSEGK
jgi:hypothetical protein